MPSMNVKCKNVPLNISKTFEAIRKTKRQTTLKELVNIEKPVGGNKQRRLLIVIYDVMSFNTTPTNTININITITITITITIKAGKLARRTTTLNLTE